MGCPRIILEGRWPDLEPPGTNLEFQRVPNDRDLAAKYLCVDCLKLGMASVRIHPFGAERQGPVRPGAELIWRAGTSGIWLERDSMAGAGANEEMSSHGFDGYRVLWRGR